MRRYGLVGSLVLSTTLLACAQQKQSTGKSAPAARVLEATLQRTLPGRAESKIETDYRLKLVWLSAEAPDALYLRSGTAWKPLSIRRLMQHDGPVKAGPAIPLSVIRQGDTLELWGGRDITAPATIAVPENVQHALVFKSKSSNWHYLAITNMQRQPDIVMP